MGFCLSRGGNSSTEPHIAPHYCKQTVQTPGDPETSGTSVDNASRVLGLQIPLLVARNVTKSPMQWLKATEWGLSPLRPSRYNRCCGSEPRMHSYKYKSREAPLSSDQVNTVGAGWWTGDAFLQIVSIRLTLSCSCHTLHSRKARTSHLNRDWRMFTSLWQITPVHHHPSQLIHVRFYC